MPQNKQEKQKKLDQEIGVVLVELLLLFVLFLWHCAVLLRCNDFALQKNGYMVAT